MLKSPIRWVGGKKWAAPIIEELLAGRNINTLVDAFCGSAVIPLNINAEKIIMNDYDLYLINVFKMLRSRPRETWCIVRRYIEDYNSLDSMEKKSEYYYSIRNDFNNDITNVRLGLITAARFIFLNKCGFNSVMRFNKKGLFNTPFGKKKSIELPEISEDMKYIDEISRKLNKITIKCGDFEDTIDWNTLSNNDVVVFDSPYIATYDGYTADGFDMSEHERLFRLFDKLAKQGVRIIAFNSDDALVYEMYKNYDIKTVNVRHNVNRVGSNRNSKETIITANI